MKIDLSVGPSDDATTHAVTKIDLSVGKLAAEVLPSTDAVTLLRKKVADAIKSVLVEDNNFMIAMVGAAGVHKAAVYSVAQELRDGGWDVFVGHDLTGSGKKTEINWWLRISYAN